MKPALSQEARNPEAGVIYGEYAENRALIAFWGRGVSFIYRASGLSATPRGVMADFSKVRPSAEEVLPVFSGDISDIVEEIGKQHPNCSVAVCLVRSDGTNEKVAIKNAQTA